MIIAEDLKIFIHYGTSPTLVYRCSKYLFHLLFNLYFYLFNETDFKNISKKLTNLISIDI